MQFFPFAFPTFYFSMHLIFSLVAIPNPVYDLCILCNIYPYLGNSNFTNSRFLKCLTGGNFSWDSDRQENDVHQAAALCNNLFQLLSACILG